MRARSSSRRGVNSVEGRAAFSSASAASTVPSSVTRPTGRALSGGAGRGAAGGARVGAGTRPRAHFVPVVVLAVGPEDRHRRHVVFGADARRQPDGGDGLQ